MQAGRGRRAAGLDGDLVRRLGAGGRRAPASRAGRGAARRVIMPYLWCRRPHASTSSRFGPIGRRRARARRRQTAGAGDRRGTV